METPPVRKTLAVRTAQEEPESGSSCVNRPSVKSNEEQLGRQPVQSTA